MYSFGQDMSVVNVPFETNTARLHQQLVRDGKLAGEFDRTYLDNLKNGVRYWDGKEWRKEVCRVNAPSVITSD